MARMIGGPSLYLEKERYVAKYISALFMIGMYLAYFLYLVANQRLIEQPLIATALGLGMLVIYKYINDFAWKYLRKARYFKLGQEGEKEIYDELSKLPDEYVVIQDVKIPSTKTNIDFVVLGPNGIWAIEVKSHKGKITYNGKELLRNGYLLEKNFLWQVRTEAISLTEYLQANIDRSLYVNALLVFSSSKAKMRFGESPVTGVVIIGREWLIKHITGRLAQNTLKSEQIEQITRLLHNY